MDTERRRSIRLRGYDYSQPGAYFVTICARDSQCVLGEVTGDRVALSALGLLSHALWEQIPDHFPNVTLDEWIVMPNHVHGILLIGERRGTAPSTCALGRCAVPLPRSASVNPLWDRYRQSSGRTRLLSPGTQGAPDLEGLSGNADSTNMC